MAKSKNDIAKSAAIAYYGFSSRTDGFPKGTEINVYEGDNRNDVDPSTKRLNEALVSIWNDNVGTLSRTARLSETDIAFHAQSIGLALAKGKVEKWMKGIADLNNHILLVEIVNRDRKKLLLVNTEVTM